jgi:hypothetical protein
VYSELDGPLVNGDDIKYHADSIVDGILSKFNLIMGVSLVNSSAELLGGKIRPGCEKKFSRQQTVPSTMWGSWYSLLLSIAGKMDDYGEKVEFLTIWREDYKTILVPIFSERAIVSLAIDSDVDSRAVVFKVKQFLKESLPREPAMG